MNDANRYEIVRLARKGLAADEIAVRMNDHAVPTMQECVSVEEVEAELNRLTAAEDAALSQTPTKTRIVRRAEILVFEIHQTWNGKEWADSDTSNVVTEEDFAEARVGDELKIARLGQLAEDLLEFAKANATRVEITNAKEEE